MKRQFQHIKNFVNDIKDINLNTRDNKSEALSTDLKKAEKKLDLIKQVCQNTEKKITACLQLLPSGHLNNNSFAERNLNTTSAMNSSFVNSLSSNTEDQLMDTLLEKKQKKVPEVQLHQTLQELGDLFDNDSILGITLSESGEIQKQLSKELLRYEQDVERLCLSPLNNIMENDIPAVLKSRKLLGKVSSEVDSLKLKLNQAIKHNQQSSGNNQAQQKAKIDSLTKELQDASLRLVQVKNDFVMDLYNFLGRECEFSCIYLQLFKLRANYHKNVVDIIEQNMPRLENIILSTNQKPVFGTSLIEYAELANRELSIVLEYCICMLNENLNEEGLFRVPGSTSKVKKLKMFFNLQTYQMIQQYNASQANGDQSGGFYLANLENYDEFVNDPHSVAGCLKSYFRELPEPLFVFAVYDDLVQCAGIANTNDRLTALWKIVNAMPKPHIENLRYLIKFFARLSANSETNKMTPQNLAIAIAPSLIWQPPAASAEGNSSPSSSASPMTYGLDMCSANQYGIIIETLILYSDWFFPGEIKFDSLKADRKRSSSADQSSTPGRSAQSSPKSTNKCSFSAGVSRTPMPTDRSAERSTPQPSITPRMSTRSKKQPAPIPPISKALNQSNGNQSGLDLSNQNPNFNESTSHQPNTSSNFVTNSPFLNSTSYSFQGEPKAVGQSEVPTLKSFERKGSLEHQPFGRHSIAGKHHGSNSSSGTGSTSDSQDSVNSFNSNTVIENAGPQKFDPNNRSNDSLLSSSRTEPASDYQRLDQQFKLSSSSSENLLDDIPANSASTPHAQTKKVMMASQHQTAGGNNLIGGSLDRRQLSQLRNERSRQIHQHKTSSSFMNRPGKRPSSIPPEPPARPAPLEKPRSHDDLLTDGGEPGAVRFSSLKRDEEPEVGDDRDEPDKKYNLKLDVKGADYESGEQEETVDTASGETSGLVSYVKLEGNEVRFGQNAEETNKPLEKPLEKPPEKPPRTSPPLEKPPRPQAPTIFKSSKSLMSSEHTYL